MAEEREEITKPETIGLPHELADAINKINKFCTERITDCSTCPLFSGLLEDGMQCVYQCLHPSEVDAKRLSDMNSYNISTNASNLPEVGTVIHKGSYEFIVLDYVDGIALIYSKSNVKSGDFGSDANYKTSSVRTWLNKAFYNTMCKIFGKENIVKHKVDLTSEDGSGEHTFVEDFVSLITLSNYRKYSRYIDHPGWCWTATRKTCVDFSSEFEYICCTSGDGTIISSCCTAGVGYIRPFIVVKAEALLSDN